jgi:ATP-dependent DNA ligase
MAKSKNNELDQIKSRRLEEKKSLCAYDVTLHQPLEPKKPAEFRFDKEQIASFEYPIRIGNTLVEKKSDGFCVLVSIDHGSTDKIKLYSSQGNEWNPNCFPELTQGLLTLPSGVFHGELLGAKPAHREAFGSLDEYIAISKRPKQSTKELTASIIEQYPLKIDFFDALKIGSKTLIAKPLFERRRALEQILDHAHNISTIAQWEINTTQALHDRFMAAIGNGYEGLIAKDPNSLYVPGSRNTDWIKLKEFMTLDLAVIGFYETDESRTAGKLFSAVLLASYNNQTEQFETVAKVKVGKREDQQDIYDRIKGTGRLFEYSQGKERGMVFNPSMHKIERKIPDSIVHYLTSENIAIVEVQTQDVTYSKNWHSCGLSYDGIKAHSLRIPTYKQLRADKSSVDDITSTQQIHEYAVG